MSNKFLLSSGILLMIIGSSIFISAKQFVCMPIFGCYWEDIHLRKREIELIEGTSYITIGLSLACLTAGFIKDK